MFLICIKHGVSVVDRLFPPQDIERLAQLVAQRRKPSLKALMSVDGEKRTSHLAGSMSDLGSIPDVPEGWAERQILTHSGL